MAAGELAVAINIYGEKATRQLDDIRKEIQKQGKEWEKSTKQVTGMVKGIGQLVIGYQVLSRTLRGFTQTISEALDLYGEQQKAEMKLQSVLNATNEAIGFNAEQLKAYASELQNATTVGDEAILNTQAVLATFKNVSGDAFKEGTRLILDMAEVLDGDLKGAAIQVGKALNDPVEGINALSRVGVSFTKRQIEMVRYFEETNDLASAQAVILKELSSEFGGAASDAVDTYAGKVKQLNNQWGDTKELLGELIAVIYSLEDATEGGNKALGATNSYLESAIPMWHKWRKSAEDAIATVFRPHAELTVMAFPDLFPPDVEVPQGLKDRIRAQEEHNKQLREYQAELKFVGHELKQTWEGVKDPFENIFGTVKGLAKETGDALKKGIAGGIEELEDFARTFRDELKTPAEKLLDDWERISEVMGKGFLTEKDVVKWIERQREAFEMAPEERPAFRAGFESLADMNRRIQAAAAGNPELEESRKHTRQNERQIEEQRAANKLLDKIETKIGPARMS